MIRDDEVDFFALQQPNRRFTGSCTKHAMIATERRGQRFAGVIVCIDDEDRLAARGHVPQYSRSGMGWLWFVAVTGWLLALAALGTARRLSRRHAQLYELYWELKYEHTELKSRIKAIAPTADEQLSERPPAQQSFVPLASLKRDRAADSRR